MIDMCAAPGGKSLHMGDKMEGFGTVDARDVSQYKVNLIEENIQSAGFNQCSGKGAGCQLYSMWNRNVRQILYWQMCRAPAMES